LDLREVQRYPFIAASKGSHSLLSDRIREAATSVGARLGDERTVSADLYLDIATSDAIAFPSRERGEQGVASGLVMLDLLPRPRPLELHVVWRPGDDDRSVNAARTFLTELRGDPQQFSIDPRR